MNLRMVENTPEYWQFIREVRFHPDNLYGYVYNNPISEDQQNRYMEKHHQEYLICCDGDVPVGFIGVVDDDLRLGVYPTHKRLGVGTFMVKQILEKMSDFKIRVKITNEISLSFFKSLGYTPEFYILEKRNT